MADLFFGTGITHSILLVSFAVAMGLLLGKWHVHGVSFGSTWILFVGIALSHFGFICDAPVLSFVKDFGLVLFVFSIGLSVGPGFFHSFKKGGLQLNLLALAMVALAVLVTVVLHFASGESLVTMTGVMSGAVTNTPGLGAAQAALGASEQAGTMASAYAVAYPIGVIGTILLLVASRSLFKVDLELEAHALESGGGEEKVSRVYCMVENPAIFGKTMGDITKVASFPFIVSRIMDKDGKVSIPKGDTVLCEGYKVLAVVAQKDVAAVPLLFGTQVEMHLTDWEAADKNDVTRKVIVTKPSFTGKRLDEIDLRGMFGVTVTRVTRAGVNMLATPATRLQMGDALRIVGPEENCEHAASLLGNKQEALARPNLVPIFFGIVFGVLLGSIPFKIPMVPQSVKLGIAGGPLIVAILLGHFGPRYHITTYTTMSANLMIRDIGISLFMAGVGLGSGQSFVSALVSGGWWWILYGACITLIPVALVIVVGRLVLKVNFLQIAGLIAGSMTSPPVLSFSQESYSAAHCSVSYATVYPLVMFLRVLAAQVLVLAAM